MEHKIPHRSTEKNKKLLLEVAAKLFLQKGYTATTLREIAKEAGVNIGSLMYTYESKENILADLVPIVLHGQFGFSSQILHGVTEDKILYWATETALQLHMAESNEAVRELYLMAYSLPKPSAVIYQHIAEKLQVFFQANFPEYEAKDFYELEIASGGIIRSFMSVPCDLYFDINRKIRRYLQTSFRIYELPEEKAEEAFRFVSAIDFTTATQQLVDLLLKKIEQE